MPETTPPAALTDEQAMELARDCCGRFLGLAESLVADVKLEPAIVTGALAAALVDWARINEGPERARAWLQQIPQIIDEGAVPPQLVAEIAADGDNATDAARGIRTIAAGLIRGGMAARLAGEIVVGAGAAVLVEAVGAEAAAATLRRAAGMVEIGEPAGRA